MDNSPIFVSKYRWRVSFYPLVFLLTMLVPLHLVAQGIAQTDDQLAEDNPAEEKSVELASAPNAFGTEVAVNGESTDEQLSAYRVAMRIILLQNSGDKSLLNAPDVQRALVEADKYIVDSRYRVPGSDDRITRATPLTPKVRRSNEATHLLNIQFNEALILGLIADQTAPAAEPDPDAEPDVPTSALVWLTVNDGNEEHRIGGPTGANVIERLREIAGGVGQRLVFPEQDALDLQALTTADMQSGNAQRLLTASRRYKEDVVLLGVLTRERGSSWLANWSRYYEGSVDEFNDTASNLDQALQQGTRWLASSAQSLGADTDLQQERDNDSTQANQGFGSQNSSFGRRNNADSSFIWISSLQSLEGYAELLQMIDEVESVEVVFPSEILPSGVMFSVSPRFALSDVTSQLAAVPWLRASLQGGVAQTLEQRPIDQPDATYEYTR